MSSYACKTASTTCGGRPTNPTESLWPSQRHPLENSSPPSTSEPGPYPDGHVQERRKALQQKRPSPMQHHAVPCHHLVAGTSCKPSARLPQHRGTMPIPPAELRARCEQCLGKLWLRRMILEGTQDRRSLLLCSEPGSSCLLNEVTKVLDDLGNGIALARGRPGI